MLIYRDITQIIIFAHRLKWCFFYCAHVFTSLRVPSISSIPNIMCTNRYELIFIYYIQYTQCFTVFVRANNFLKINKNVNLYFFFFGIVTSLRFIKLIYLIKIRSVKNFALKIRMVKYVVKVGLEPAVYVAEQPAICTRSTPARHPVRVCV